MLPIAFWLLYPEDRPCEPRLQVELDELPAGEYELWIHGNDYANHCRLFRQRWLRATCDDETNVLIMNEVGRLTFPSRARTVFLEIRRGATALVARDFGVWQTANSLGCTNGSVGVPFDTHPREPWPEPEPAP